MHKTTVVVFIVCSMVAATTAVPLSQKLGKHTSSTFGKNGKSAISEKQVKNVIFLRHLSTLYTKNWFADIIRATLGLSVKELLVKIETTFKDLDRVTKQGVNELNQVINLASPEIKTELETIRNNAISKVFEMVEEFLGDLGRVLPALSPQFTTLDPSADIVFALLGKTLEELVTAMTRALEQSLVILNETIVKFRVITARATPAVGNALTKISNEYLQQGRGIVSPMLHQLQQLVNTNPITTRRTTNRGDGEQHYQDLLDAIISTVLGVNVESVAFEADKVLSELIPIFETTRDDLNEALASTHKNDTSTENQVQTNVMNIYDSAMDDVIRDAKPIFTVLLQFEDNARREKTFAYDMSESLLGIEVDTFKSYIKNASLRVENTIKSSRAQIIAASAKAGIPALLKVWRILFERLRFAKQVSKSFLESLKIISEKQGTNGIDEIVKVEEETWAEDDGVPYNRDVLINAASQLLGVQVTDATTILKTSLEKLDELMEFALVELQNILSEPEVDADMRKDILETMNDTLTDIHITLQPILDVLLPFLPDAIRRNKRVAFDIYAGTNGVNLDSFVRYCSSVARKIPETAGIATVRIRTIAARAGPNVHGKIEALLQITDDQSKTIIQPFIDVVGPIISQR